MSSIHFILVFPQVKVLCGMLPTVWVTSIWILPSEMGCGVFTWAMPFLVMLIASCAFAKASFPFSKFPLKDTTSSSFSSTFFPTRTFCDNGRTFPYFLGRLRSYTCVFSIILIFLNDTLTLKGIALSLRGEILSFLWLSVSEGHWSFSTWFDPIFSSSTNLCASSLILLSQGKSNNEPRQRPKPASYLKNP